MSAANITLTSGILPASEGNTNPICPRDFADQSLQKKWFTKCNVDKACVYKIKLLTKCNVFAMKKVATFEVFVLLL